MTLDWTEGEFGLECTITQNFILRLERDHKTPGYFHVAILNQRLYGTAEYRSNRSWPEAEAKSEAVKAGIRAALRISKRHQEIAAALRTARLTANAGSSRREC